MSRRWLLAALLVVFVLPAHAGKLYKWVDDKGNVHYSDTNPTEGKVLSRTSTDDAVPGSPDYCRALHKFATKVAERMRMGVPVEEMIASVRPIEREIMEQHQEVEEPILRQVVYYVYVYKHGTAAPATIANHAHSQCLSGVYSPGRKASKGETADSNSGASGARDGDTSQGTGWVGAGGYIVTNHHVVRGHDRITVIFPNGEKLSATVSSADEENDFALLRASGLAQLAPSIPLASGDAAIGSEVFTIGYPHTDIMGSKPKLTAGIINAQTGYRDDPRTYQTSVQVQSGNSGGPLLNRRGEVVGVVTAKLSAATVFKWTGDLPQNVNYAVKGRLLAPHLNGTAGHPELPRTAASLEALAERIQNSVVMVVAE